MKVMYILNSKNETVMAVKFNKINCNFPQSFTFYIDVIEVFSLYKEYIQGNLVFLNNNGSTKFYELKLK